MDVYTKDKKAYFTVIHSEIMLPCEYALLKYTRFSPDTASMVKIPGDIYPDSPGTMYITTIRDKAFSNDDHITAVDIPKTVKFILSHAFHNVKNLSVIRINNPNCRIADTAIEYICDDSEESGKTITLYCHPNSVAEEYAKFLRTPIGVELNIKYFSRSKLKQRVYDLDKDEGR